MKKLSAIILTALAASALSATAFAASALSATAFAAGSISADVALAIARQQVPATCTHLFTKAENNKLQPYYEVKFYDNTTNTEYEIDVLQNNGALREYSMDAKALFGSSKIVLSVSDIQELVRKEYPNAVFHKIELDSDNGLYEYETEFKAPGLIGEIKHNPETGAVLEKELKYQF